MIVICHFILAVVYLYDGEYHRRHLVNQTSYVCGTLWMVTAVYELMNMPKVQNFIYTVSRIERLADSFIEEFQALEPSMIMALVMIMMLTLAVFVAKWHVWNYPASYMEDSAGLLFGLFMIPVEMFVVMGITGVVDGEDHYAVSTVCIFFVIITVLAAYRTYRQICTIDQDIRNYFLLL